MPLPPALVDRVRRHDDALAPLRDYGFDIGKPGFVARMKAKQDEAKAKYAVDEALSAEIDRELTPELLHLYAAADDATREELRALLRQYRHVRDTLRTPPSDDAARRFRDALVLLALKDGDPIDWRDEILTLDALCRGAQARALDTAQLLREAAALASDAPRGDLPSFRATLLRRAEKIAQAGS
jgi:hypothetical protein